MKINPQDDNFFLEWKKYDVFYNSLNNKLDEISNIGEECYSDYSKIYLYFAKTKNLFNKHYAYIFKPEMMREEFKKIQLILYDDTLLKDLKQNKKEALKYLFQIFDKLQDLYTKMVVYFTYPALIPKPIKIERDPFAEEKDPTKKKMYSVVLKMFENV